MNNEEIVIYIFLSIFGIIGIVFFIVGIILSNIWKKKTNNCTEIAYGKIIDIIKRESRRDMDRRSRMTSWYPVIEYKIGSQKYTREYGYGNLESKYIIGQDVQICFNPENLEEYYIMGDTLLKTTAKVFSTIGIVSLVIVGFILISII